MENILSSTNDTKIVRDVREQLELLKLKPQLNPISISNAIQIITKQLLTTRNIVRIMDFQLFLFSVFNNLDSQLLILVINTLFDTHFDLLTTTTLIYLLLDRQLNVETKQSLSRILKMFEDNSLQVNMELLTDMKQHKNISMVPNLYVIKDFKSICGFVKDEVFSIDYAVMDWLLNLEYDPSITPGIDIDYTSYIGFNGLNSDNQVTEEEVDEVVKEVLGEGFDDLNDRLQQLLNKK